MDLIPRRLKEPMYRLYELRLRQGLSLKRSELPRHIAVLCDGNRRWARETGHDDVAYGYRAGARKIAEMLRWCQDAGIEMATVYLLSTENLQRDADELAALIEIITEVVEEICAPAKQWSVRTVGDLELLGQEVRVLHVSLVEREVRLELPVADALEALQIGPGPRGVLLRHGVTCDEWLGEVRGWGALRQRSCLREALEIVVAMRTVKPLSALSGRVRALLTLE